MQAQTQDQLSPEDLQALQSTLETLRKSNDPRADKLQTWIQQSQTGPDDRMAQSLQNATISPPQPGISGAIDRFRARVNTALSGGGRPEAAVQVIGGPALGPLNVAHGVAIAPSHPVRGLNEMVRGTGQTLALPMAVVNPATMAYSAPGVVAQTGVQKGLEAAGVDKDYAELGGNIAGIATSGAAAKPEVPVKVVKSIGAIAKPLTKLPVLDKTFAALKAVKEIKGDLKDIWTDDSAPTPGAVQAVKDFDFGRYMGLRKYLAAKGQTTPPETPAPENTPIQKVTSGDPRTRVTLGTPGQSGDYSVAPILQGGKEVGRIVYQVEGDRATIHWVGDSAMKNSLSNQLGPVGLRQVFMKFGKQNPEVKTLQGIRVGGARGDEGLSTVYDMGDLYAKTPQRNLIPTHERQLAGQPGRVGVTHKPSPAEQMTVPAGDMSVPRVPGNDEDIAALLMESLRQIKAQRSQ